MMLHYCVAFIVSVLALGVRCFIACFYFQDSKPRCPVRRDVSHVIPVSFSISATLLQTPPLPHRLSRLVWFTAGRPGSCGAAQGEADAGVLLQPAGPRPAAARRRGDGPAADAARALHGRQGEALQTRERGECCRAAGELLCCRGGKVVWCGQVPDCGARATEVADWEVTKVLGSRCMASRSDGR